MAASSTTGTLASVAPALLQVLMDPEVTDQCDKSALLLDAIEHGDQSTQAAMDRSITYDGEYVFALLHTDYNANVPAGYDGGPLAVPGSQSTARAKYRCKIMQHAIGMTDDVMIRAGGSPQSAIDIMAFEQSAIFPVLRKTMNWNMHRDGSGLISACTSSGFDNANSILYVSDNKYFRTGMAIILRGLTTGSPYGVPTATGLPTSYPVTTYTTGNKLYVSGKSSDGTGDYITLASDAALATAYTTAMTVNATHGVYQWDSQGRYPYGIDAYCIATNPPYSGYDYANTVTATDGGSATTGVLACPGAIDRTAAANAYWKALNSTDDGITTALGSTPITIKGSIQPLIKAIYDTGLGDADMRGQDFMIAVSDMDVWYQIVNDMESAKQTTVRTMVLDGKYEGARYGPITFVFDTDAEANTLKVFAPKFLYRMVAQPWQPWGVSLDGAQWRHIKNSAGDPTMNWRRDLTTRQQLVSTRCRQNCKFTGIA